MWVFAWLCGQHEVRAYIAAVVVLQNIVHAIQGELTSWTDFCYCYSVHSLMLFPFFLQDKLCLVSLIKNTILTTSIYRQKFHVSKINYTNFNIG